MYKTTLVPFNTSGRTKDEIVEAMENGPLAALLVGHTPMIHSDLCRCNSCIQNKLDEMVKRSDEITGGLN